MNHRHVYVSHKSKLLTAYEQLLIEQDDITKKDSVQIGLPMQYTVPFEDIGSILIENRATYLSASVLSKAASYGVVVYVCDDKHMPNGILLPYNQYFRPLKMWNFQISAKKPLLKNMWRYIVKTKIQNQARCLRFAKQDGERELLSIAERVESGDRSNMEAYAAQRYFKLLFGNNFARRRENFTNSALNYGYALLRGQVARSLSMYGLQPFLGLQHHNELNNFNLADDLMEPYRPIVDLVVKTEIHQDESGVLTSKHKQRLYRILTQLILFNGQKYNVTSSVDAMVNSFSQALQHSNHQLLVLPNLIMIEMEESE